jgi:uncharacterized protein (TIGR01370 family)
MTTGWPGMAPRRQGRRAVGRGLAAALFGLAACAPLRAGGGAALAGRAPGDSTMRFLVYYGTADDPALEGYDLAVLDAEVDGALLARRRGGAAFLGYLSVGEIHAQRSYFAEAQSQGLLIERHPSWPDAWFVDMREARWKRHVVEDLVPSILGRGFGGVFLDTLDDAEYLEARDPVRFAGMTAHAAGIVRELRRRHPSAQIMVNRGYALLPQIVGQFDMLLGESVRGTYVAANGTYALVRDRDYDWQRQRMWEARRRDPRLRLFSLDYWEPQDREGIARLYAEQRANGFVPYVATPDLTRIVPSP